MFYDRRPRNAWKHGGYSNLGVLPGEDPQEFNALHQSLIAEYKPSGPTECDAILSVATCMWRKSRLTIYARAAAARTEWEPLFAKFRGSSLRSDALIEAVLVEKMMQESQRVKALISKQALEANRERKEITAELAKALAEMLKHPAFADLDVRAGVREISVDLELAQLCDQITPETLIEELELASRLDARIDRLLKWLFQLKAAKQMLGLESRSQERSSTPRKLSSPQASQANGGGEVAADEVYAAAGGSRTAS
jgi:antitoxin component of MazEF toxin-antitoxin module